jgi:hypothetical protein
MDGAAEKSQRTHFFFTYFASLPIFLPRSAAMNSLATEAGAGFFPCDRNFARPAAVRLIAMNAC